MDYGDVMAREHGSSNIITTVTYEDVAHMCGVSRRTVSRSLRDDKLPDPRWGASKVLFFQRLYELLKKKGLIE